RGVADVLHHGVDAGCGAGLGDAVAHRARADDPYRLNGHGRCPRSVDKARILSGRRAASARPALAKAALQTSERISAAHAATSTAISGTTSGTNRMAERRAGASF